MPQGPGKYNELCTYVRLQAKAQAAIIVVINGDKGSGFSVQQPEGSALELAQLLETMAADIRKSMEGK